MPARGFDDRGLTLVTEDRQLPEIPNLGAIGFDKFMAQIGASND